MTLERRIDPAFESELHRRAWPAGVAVIDHGRVATSTGAIVSAGDALIYDVSHTAASDDPRQHPIFLARKLPRLSRMGGSVAVLTTYTSNVPTMFYFVHWLLDTLPRLHLIERSGVGWDRLVAPQAMRFQRETLALLGIAPERIIDARDLYIEAERLVVPTLPGLPVNPPKWVCDYLCDIFVPMAGAPERRGRKLYLSRAKARTRHVTNEADLLAALGGLGFEPIFLEDYPFLEQVRIMRECSMVVAPHGASNASLVFCNPGTSFVELFSPRYVNVCYWSLCNQVGVRYGYVLGEGRAGGRQAHEAITAPIPKLLRLLDEMRSVAVPA
jgi:capsular polysaccharide biosynthesis protein